jgi:hypothetical protein
MWLHSTPRNSNRHCEDGCDDVFGIYYLRDYQQALGTLAASILRADEEARRFAVAGLVRTRDEIETQLRRVHQWSRGASRLHRPGCWWLEELTIIKRKLLERSVWHTNLVARLMQAEAHA